MVAQIANAEAGSSVRSKLNAVLASTVGRRVWGVKLAEASPFEAVWLTETELRDIIGVFGTDTRGLVPTPGTPTGTRVLYDTGWAEASASVVDAVDDATAYPTGAAYTVTSVFNQHRFFVNAANHFVQFPLGLSEEPAAHGRFTAPVANTLTLRRVAGFGVQFNRVHASDGFTWVVPAGGTVEWLVSGPGQIELAGDSTAELALVGPLNLASNKIIPGAPISVTTGTRSYNADDSGKCFRIDTTAGTQTIPSGLPSGWEITILNNTGSPVTIDGPGGNNPTLASGQVCNIKYWSTTTIKIVIGDTVGIN